MKEKWYDPDMHGVDWAAVGENYRQFVPYITDNFAFRELLSEMLGELNGSHTGGRYRHGMGGAIGRLGVIYDDEYTGKGLKIKGRSGNQGGRRDPRNRRGGDPPGQTLV